MKAAKLITDERKKLKLTAGEFSKKAGISSSIYSSWENGDGFPSKIDCIKLSDFFEIEFEKLWSIVVNERITTKYNEQLFTRTIINIALPIIPIIIEYLIRAYKGNTEFPTASCLILTYMIPICYSSEFSNKNIQLLISVMFGFGIIPYILTIFEDPKRTESFYIIGFLFSIIFSFILVIIDLKEIRRKKINMINKHTY